MKTLAAETTTGSIEETQRLAAAVAAMLVPGDVLCLYGQLGAGKTYFTKGLVAGLGGDGEAVTSPTFVLMQIYEGCHGPDKPPPDGLAGCHGCPAAMSGDAHASHACGAGMAPGRETGSDRGQALLDHGTRRGGARLPVYHFDAYRLRSAQDLLDIGSDEILDDDGVSVIEWADRVAEAMPGERIEVYLTPVGATERRVRLVGRGEHEAAVVAGLVREGLATVVET